MNLSLALLFTLVGLPLVGALILALWVRASERTASGISTLVFAVHHFFSLGLFGLWAKNGFQGREFYVGELFRQGKYLFPVVFYVDGVSVIFLLLTTFLTGLVFHFSRYYLHRDSRYVTFFGRILLFLSGMTIVVTAGNFDQLFAGWEIVGLSSFLLIAFYHERIQPVRNAIRVYSVYRLCDVGLLMGALLTHLLWHETTRFAVLSASPVHLELQAQNFLSTVGLGLLILLAAAGKSAQFPFTFWLPRSMEGPTPSSAIFYGALSVHLGVFLLLRTFPLWTSSLTVQIFVGTVGLCTALLSTLNGRAQSDIKGQIAYGSAAQVGLMFVELALGFPTLAIIHAVGNASLRCYQLLASPSIVSYRLRLLGSAERAPRSFSWERWLSSRLRTNLYVLTLNEGFLEALVKGALLTPVRNLGDLIQKHRIWFERFVLPTMALLLTLRLGGVISPSFLLTLLMSGCLMVCALMAFTENRSAYTAWNMVAVSLLGNVLLLMLVEPDSLPAMEIYWVGLAVCWALGLLALRSLLGGETGAASVTHYLGRGRGRPWGSLFLLFAALGLGGFPNTPAFIGEDLMLYHLARDHKWIALVVSAGFVMNGITLMKIFALVCFGPEREVLIRENAV